MLTGNAICRSVVTASRSEYVLCHCSWRCQPGTWWQDDYTPSTTGEAELYTHWHSPADHPKSPQLPSPYIVTIMVFHTPALLSRMFTSQRKNQQIFKDNGISLPCCTPLSRTCGASRMFNGLLKTQWWCRLGENIWESCPYMIFMLSKDNHSRVLLFHPQPEGKFRFGEGWNWREMFHVYTKSPIGKFSSVSGGD